MKLTDALACVYQFNLPLGRATALGQQTSMMLGINVQGKNATSGKKNVGVTCPQICKKC